VCERHFSKNSLIVEKNLRESAVPTLHLKEENFKLENDCCGFCLEDLNERHEIQHESKDIFMEITGYAVSSQYPVGVYTLFHLI
jgi:hypothetical protein